MKLLGLSFDEEANPSPDRITTVMTRDEALLIVTVLGRMTGVDQNAVMAGGDQIGTDVYDCLVGNVFNRYWEDGVEEAMSGRVT